MTDKKESRLGASPLNGMDLLSSTVNVAKPVEPSKKKTVSMPVKKETPKKSVKVKVPTPPKATPEVESKPGDQYGYDKQSKWPLLPEPTPYLIPVSQSGDKVLSTAF